MLIGRLVIAETEFSEGKIVVVRAGLGVGFCFNGGLAVGDEDGDAVGVGVGIEVGVGVWVRVFTGTPLFQINFLPDLTQVNILPW